MMTLLQVPNLEVFNAEEECSTVCGLVTVILDSRPTHRPAVLQAPGAQHCNATAAEDMTVLEDKVITHDNQAYIC